MSDPTRPRGVPAGGAVRRVRSQLTSAITAAPPTVTATTAAPRCAKISS